MQHKVQPWHLLIGLAGIGAGAAHATPTSAPLWGPSGLGIMPTTDTVPRRHGEVNLSFQNVDPEGGGNVRYFPVIMANYGFKRGEIGGGFVREKCDCGPTGSSGPFGLRYKYYNYGVLHAKYRVAGDPNRGAALAVGAHFLHFNSERGQYVGTGYLTGSLPLLRGGGELPKVRANLGVLYQQIRLANRENVTRPAFGLEFLPSKSFSIVADYIPKSGVAERLMSLSARYQGETLGAAVGVGRLRDDTSIFGNVSYRFGVDDDDDDSSQH